MFIPHQIVKFKNREVCYRVWADWGIIESVGGDDAVVWIPNNGSRTIRCHLDSLILASPQEANECRDRLQLVDIPWYSGTGDIISIGDMIGWYVSETRWQQTPHSPIGYHYGRVKFMAGEYLAVDVISNGDKKPLTRLNSREYSLIVLSPEEAMEFELSR